MPADDHGSVTLWLGGLKAGDPDAAQALWERYFGRLARMAGARLRAASRAATGGDGEDAALSALDCVCAGAARGRFPRLDDRDDLWRLLVTVTDRKVTDRARRGNRVKRGGGRRVLDEAALAGPGAG